MDFVERSYKRMQGVTRKEGIMHRKEEETKQPMILFHGNKHGREDEVGAD